MIWISLFVLATMIHACHGFSEVIHGDSKSTIACTEASRPDGCHVKCIGSSACDSTTIYCFPDVPCFVECHGSYACDYADLIGNSASNFEIALSGYRSGRGAQIQGTKNGPSVIHLMGGGEHALQSARISGQIGQKVSLFVEATGLNQLERTLFECPEVFDDDDRCSFHCIGSSDCQHLNVMTQDEFPDQSIVQCDQSSDCSSVEIYAQMDYCIMEWDQNENEWICIDQNIPSNASEIIWGKGEWGHAIQCSEESEPNGCHVFCIERGDCEFNEIYCYDGFPCTIDCVARPPGERFVCIVSQIYGQESSRLDVILKGDDSGVSSQIHAAETGPTYVEIGSGSGTMAYSFIYGKDGQVLSVIVNKSRSDGIDNLVLDCPGNPGLDNPLCHFECIGCLSTNVTIYADNGIPEDLDIFCDESSDCSGVTVYCDDGYCQMTWDDISSEWICQNVNGTCSDSTLRPTSSPVITMDDEGNSNTGSRNQDWIIWLIIVFIVFGICLCVITLVYLKVQSKRPREKFDDTPNGTETIPMNSEVVLPEVTAPEMGGEGIENPLSWSSVQVAQWLRSNMERDEWKIGWTSDDIERITSEFVTNQVTGKTLISEIDNLTLKEDLNISILGQRRQILEWVSDLSDI